MTYEGGYGILIHTSVKLVTHAGGGRGALQAILIHTSVKLVTLRPLPQLRADAHFNPHEREARDITLDEEMLQKIILIHTSVKLVTSEGLF